MSPRQILKTSGRLLCINNLLDHVTHTSKKRSWHSPSVRTRHCQLPVAACLQNWYDEVFDRDVRFNSLIEYVYNAEFSSESADGARRVVAGLNVLKSGKDPEELKDEDVPEWLWKLADEGNGKSLMEMERRVARVMEEGEGQGDVVETMREAKYLSKLQNRSKIRGRNALKAKK